MLYLELVPGLLDASEDGCYFAGNHLFLRLHVYDVVVWNIGYAYVLKFDIFKTTLNECE